MSCLPTSVSALRVRSSYLHKGAPTPQETVVRWSRRLGGYGATVWRSAQICGTAGAEISTSAVGDRTLYFAQLAGRQCRGPTYLLFKEVVPVHDLAPDIVRQRLLVEGHFTIDVDEPVIHRFFDQFTEGMGFRTYGVPTVFAPSGDGRAENQGYDAFVPLIDSGISLYVWSAPRFLAIVVFTCKRFDADKAISLAHGFFDMSDLAHREF